MADQTFGNQNASVSPQGFQKAATTPKGVADQALSAGRDLKDKAMGVAGSSSDAIKDQASGFIDAAKDVASQATGKLKETVDGQNVPKAGCEEKNREEKGGEEEAARQKGKEGKEAVSRDAPQRHFDRACPPREVRLGSA